jgi:hypothetical protein
MSCGGCQAVAARQRDPDFLWSRSTVSGNLLLEKNFERHSVCRATFLTCPATIERVVTNKFYTVERDRHPPVVPCDLPDGIQLVYTDDRCRRRAITLDEAGAIDFGRARPFREPPALPAAHVDGPAVDYIVTGDQVKPFVVGHGRIDVRRD